MDTIVRLSAWDRASAQLFITVRKATACVIAFSALTCSSAGAVDTRFLQGSAAADGSIANPVDTSTTYQSTAEAALTLRHSDTPRPDLITSALSYLNAAAQPWTTEQLTLAIRVRAVADQSADAQLSELLTRQNQDGGFGSFAGNDSNALDTALALEALGAAGQTSSPSAQEALGFLLVRQATNGSWTIGANADGVGIEYTTAIAMHAVWLYRLRYAVTVPLDRAQSFLLSRRTSAGVWSDDNLTALALIAILPRLQNFDSVNTAIDSVRASQAPDGSWNADVYTTALLLRVLHAADRPVPNPDLGSITGQLVDAATNAPIAGATVSLGGAATASAVTNIDGHFVFQGLAAGAYQVDAAPSGYGGFSNVLELSSGTQLNLGAIPLNAIVTATTATLRGLITRADNGAALASVTITAGGRTTTTGTDGRYEIRDLAPGGLTIIATRSGFASVAAQATALAGATIVFSPSLPVLSSAPRIQGTITDASGRQIAGGVTITLSGANTRSVTSTNGTYSFTGLVVGPTRIEAVASGYSPVSADVELKESATYTFSPVLVPLDAVTTSLQGTVVNLVTRAPIVGATVTLSGANTGTLQTDAQGRFRFDDLAPGGMSIEITAASYAPKVGALTLAAGQNAFVPVELVAEDFVPPSADVSGRVFVTGTDRPIPGAIIEASSADRTVVAVANDSGSFTLTGVTSGSWVVRARRTNYDSQETVFFMSSTPTRLNIGTLFLTEKVRFPDLILESLDRSAVRSDAATFATTGTLRGVLINLGNGATQSGFDVIAYYDADLNGAFNAPGDLVLGSQRFADVMPANGTVDLSIAISGHLPFRDAPIRVRIDPKSEVAEMLEDNNDGNTCELAACGE